MVLNQHFHCYGVISMAATAFFFICPSLEKRTVSLLFAPLLQGLTFFFVHVHCSYNCSNIVVKIGGLS